MIAKRIALVGAVALCALLAKPHAAAAATTPAIAAFDTAFAAIDDYTMDLRSHEQKGDATQNRVYRYSFLKPHFAKTLIVSGDGSGSGGVWTGGDQVSGHQGGILSAFHLKVGLHDGRAVSLLGYTIPDGLMQNVVAIFRDTPGKLSQHVGGQIDGVPTAMVELIPSSPLPVSGADRAVIYFSTVTHLPVRNIFYLDGRVVLDQSFQDVKTNVGLTQRDFPF